MLIFSNDTRPDESQLVPNVEPQWRFEYQCTLRHLLLTIKMIGGTKLTGRSLMWPEIQNEFKRCMHYPRPWWHESPMGFCELYVGRKALGRGSLSFCRAWSAMRDQRVIDVPEDWERRSYGTPMLVFYPQYPPVGTVRIYSDKRATQ